MNDAARMAVAVKQAEGKRLVYREEDVPGTISDWDTLLVLQADGTCIPLKLKSKGRKDAGRCKEARAEES